MMFVWFSRRRLHKFSDSNFFVKMILDNYTEYER